MLVEDLRNLYENILKLWRRNFSTDVQISHFDGVSKNIKKTKKFEIYLKTNVSVYF